MLLSVVTCAGGLGGGVLLAEGLGDFTVLVVVHAASSAVAMIMCVVASFVRMMRSFCVLMWFCVTRFGKAQMVRVWIKILDVPRTDALLVVFPVTPIKQIGMITHKYVFDLGVGQ